MKASPSAEPTLPTATEAERLLIGGMLLDSESIDKALKIVGPRHFSDPAHRHAFLAILQQRSSGKPLDIGLVLREVKKSPALGEQAAAFLALAMDDTPHALDVPYYAGLVVEADRKRQLYDLAQTAAQDALNGSTSQAVLNDMLAALDDFQREPGVKRRGVEKFDLGELLKLHPRLNPAVIDGLCRQGETVNLISMSKVGKSWLGYSLALSIITGRRWLDRFDTHCGRVLLIDNELHRSTLAHRIPLVAEAMGIEPHDYQGELDVWPLRGNLKSLQQLAGELEAIEAGYYRAILFDAKYRFIEPGASENDNAAETQVYNLLDRIAEKTQSALVMIHHTSKGDQSGKRTTDVGAGAGAQSRAADCHLVLREHEEPGVVVLDAAVRSFAPIEPVTLRWEFPLWRPDALLDASKLKGRLTGGEQRQTEKDQEAMTEIASALLGGPATTRKLRDATGFSRDRMARLIGLMLKRGTIIAGETDANGNTTNEYALAPTEGVVD
ncbi:Replicative DNA helicase [Pirellulimonas nuda]|uniref:Replicative DNA helicase n=1 Tax=Pirellulimonas nuda TaxID=2528009 RepID=A0A518D6U6_9BACT|nr:AAA family ATPase [Pirellulimonas nuda]QDU87197.1 Replicative DNA helicase [Pirellulimonas nuda]